MRCQVSHNKSGKGQDNHSEEWLFYRGFKQMDESAIWNPSEKLRRRATIRAAASKLGNLNNLAKNNTNIKRKEFNMRTYKHLKGCSKAELIQIIKDNDNTINYLQTQMKKAGLKIWS